MKPRLFITFFLFLSLASCSGRKQATGSDFAPKRIHSYIISFYSTLSSPMDRPDYKKEFLCFFYKDGSYRTEHRNAAPDSGDYNYIKIGPNKGRLLQSYSVDIGVKTFITYMTFNGPGEGVWTGYSEEYPDSPDEGTFTVTGKISY